MTSFSYILLIITMAAVAGVLFWGILTMARGGEYNVNWSNTIMRWRIISRLSSQLEGLRNRQRTGSWAT